MSLRTGLVIASRYRLIRRLGEGGMGEVWSAVSRTRRLVALKFLKLGTGRDPDLLARFEREARIGQTLRHPNLACAEHFLPRTEVDGAPALVMELLRGETLDDRLAREGALPVHEAARIGAAAARGLASAHAAGVVHRDMKPSNVFLTRDGGVKVLDFGIARAAFEVPLTSQGNLLGTPGYLAPEQMWGGAVDGRADVWALGVMLYKSTSGRMPWEAGTLPELFAAITTSDPRRLDAFAQVPVTFADVIHAMLRSDPARRLADLAEVESILDAATHRGEVARPSWASTRHARSCAKMTLVGAALLGTAMTVPATNRTLEMSTLIR